MIERHHTITPRVATAQAVVDNGAETDTVEENCSGCARAIDCEHIRSAEDFFTT